MRQEKNLPGNCILRIKQIYKTLKTAERQLADYILASKEQAITETMETLAAKAGVSYATVHRFYKKLGYSGFRQFKEDLIYDVINSNEVTQLVQNIAESNENTVEGVCNTVYRLAYKVLNDSVSILDTTVVRAVVDSLLAANKVCFIGVGYSGICARYAYSRFFRIGLNCIADIDQTLFRMQVALLRQGDVLVAISSSGRTEAVIEAARLAKRNGVTVVGLSDFDITPLSKIAEYNLFTTSRNAANLGDIDMPLITGQITLVDMLYMCCTVALEDTAAQNYKKTSQTAKQEKLK